MKRWYFFHPSVTGAKPEKRMDWRAALSKLVDTLDSKDSSRVCEAALIAKRDTLAPYTYEGAE